MLIILLLICEDGLLRVADPSYVEACQQHTISRYYNCDIAIGDPNVLNDPTWLTCPTFIGIMRVQNTLATISTIRLYKKYKKDILGFIAVLQTIIFSWEHVEIGFVEIASLLI